jgi:hypothetical protein
MSLLSWWSSRNVPRLPDEVSGLPAEATRPAGKRTGAVNAGSNAQPVNRKGERMAQRELLYAVVRDAMVRAGVLSSGYKFKVLSLDSRGSQFMVMVDLAADQAGSASQMAEIEASIAQSAKSRYEIVVTAVYWRRNEHVAIGDPRRATRREVASQPAALDSGPAPLESGPAPLESGPEPAAASGAARRNGERGRPTFDPILPAEVEAFKRALSAGPASSVALAHATPAAGAHAGAAHGANARAFDGSAKHGPQSYTLLTGFEDTELPDARVAALSRSQYGDLN